MFILIDDLWAHLNLDHRPAEGTRFTNGDAPCPPTRATVVTSPYPERLRS